MKVKKVGGSFFPLFVKQILRLSTLLDMTLVDVNVKMATLPSAGRGTTLRSKSRWRFHAFRAEEKGM